MRSHLQNARCARDALSAFGSARRAFLARTRPNPDNTRPFFPPPVSPMPTRFELANAIRALAMDAVQKANSG
ncbi:MAG: hypothetical protein ACLGI7_09440, partial [Gammaproteobacteria bacterium]